MPTIKSVPRKAGFWRQTFSEKTDSGELFWSLRRLAFGVALSVKSDLGIGPINSVAYVTSRILFIDLGLTIAIVYCGFVLLQLLVLGREFRPISFLQIGASVLFGWFVSLNNHILSSFTLEVYGVQVLFVLGSAVIIALGIFLYLKADMIPHPPDGLILAIQKKTRWKLHNIKVCFDGTLVVFSAAISFIALQRIIGLREGTIILVFGVGKIMGFLPKYLDPKINALFRL